MTSTVLLPNSTYRIGAAQSIHAPLPVVWEHLVTLPMSALPMGFALTLLRHLPDVLAGNERAVRGSDTFLDATPIPVVFSDEPRRLVSAGISQAWKISGGSRGPRLTADEFVEWAEPGWIKVEMSFELTDLQLTDLPGARGTHLTTETRVDATDADTARAFAPYWRLIRAASALIRREVIAQVKRRAEAELGGRSGAPAA